MTPTIEDFLSGSCRWRGEHQGIAYELSWHGRSEYSPQGTWCWYLLLSDEQFYQDDWAKLRLDRQDKDMFGSWHRHWNYENFPDLQANGGWTYGEMSSRLGRDGKEHEHVKIGCDYAHLWDRETDYRHRRADIERDARHSIDLLVTLFSRRRERCAYSGEYDDSNQFYTARNGLRVHKANEEKLRADKWGWCPADELIAKAESRQP